MVGEPAGQAPATQTASATPPDSAQSAPPHRRSDRETVLLTSFRPIDAADDEGLSAVTGAHPSRGADSGDAAGLLSHALRETGGTAREAVRRIVALDPERCNAMLALAGWHGVTCGLWRAFGADAERLPEDCAAYLEAASHLNARRNARLVGQAREIADALRAAGIRAVFLKGTALLLCDLHADPAARLVGDIDLLVASDRLEDAAAALVAAGYRRLPDRVAHAHDPVRLVREGRPGLIELHHAPVAFSLAPALSAEAVLARAEPSPPAPGALVPCPEDLVVHAVAHAMLQDHGFRLAELRLCDALDLARLAARYGDAIDWGAVAARLDRVPEGRDALVFCLHAARESLAAPLPALEPSARVRRRLSSWRGRAGGPAAAITRRAALIGVYARDWIWRLRHLPGQRRHLLARLASPTTYPSILRTLATVAAEGPPATPHRETEGPR